MRSRSGPSIHRAALVEEPPGLLPGAARSRPLLRSFEQERRGRPPEKASSTSCRRKRRTAGDLQDLVRTGAVSPMPPVASRARQSGRYQPSVASSRASATSGERSSAGEEMPEGDHLAGW